MEDSNCEASAVATALSRRVSALNQIPIALFHLEMAILRVSRLIRLAQDSFEHNPIFASSFPGFEEDDRKILLASVVFQPPSVRSLLPITDRNA